MLEERNQATADDSGMDEEDRYGAVVRGSSSKETKENVYVPPALRSKQQPVPPKSQDQQPAHFANFPPGSPLHKLTTGTLTTASPSSSSYRHESSTTTSTATITTTTTAITNSKSKVRMVRCINENLLSYPHLFWNHRNQPTTNSRHRNESNLKSPIHSANLPL